MTSQHGQHFLFDLDHVIQSFPVGRHRLRCPACGDQSRNKNVGVVVKHDGNRYGKCFRCDTKLGVIRCDSGPTPPPKMTRALSDFGRAMFDQSVPLPGTTGESYLRARKCVVPYGGDLRFHPALKHPVAGQMLPALVGLITDALTGQVISLHRTWIKPDGNKADVVPPRMLLGGHEKKGGVIRLTGEQFPAVLGVAEGIETALSLAHAMPSVWSVVDAGNLSSLPVVPGVRQLVIARDNDQSGKSASEQCAKRWAAAGVEVRLTTQSSNDLNDLLKGQS